MLQIPTLERLDFRTNLYPTDFLAWICTNYPELEGYCLKPYIVFSDHTGFICGKRKPSFDLTEDKGRILVEQAVKRFEQMKEKYAGLSFEDMMKQL